MDMNIFSIGTGGVQIGVLDILCVALLVLAAISGWRRGFMRSLIGLLSFAASIVSAYLLRPIITDVLLGTSLSNTVYGRVLSGITAQIPDTSGMPSIFSGMINDGSGRNGRDNNKGYNRHHCFCRCIYGGKNGCFNRVKAVDYRDKASGYRLCR